MDVGLYSLSCTPGLSFRQPEHLFKSAGIHTSPFLSEYKQQNKSSASHFSLVRVGLWLLVAETCLSFSHASTLLSFSLTLFPVLSLFQLTQARSHFSRSLVADKLLSKFLWERKAYIMKWNNMFLRRCSDYRDQLFCLFELKKPPSCSWPYTAGVL